jgi:DNA-3-methyladenine glycosylase II
MELAIPTAQPFAFEQTLAFVRRFPACRDQTVLTEDRLTAAVCIEGRPHAFTLREGLRCEVSRDLTPATRTAIIARAAAFVGAEDDIGALYAAAKGDAAFSRLVALLHGLHHVRFLTLQDIAVYSVFMQRAPVTVAAALNRKFLAAFGKPVDVDGRTLRAMPELGELCDLSVDDIAAAIKHRPKAERVVDVVRGVAAIGEHHLRHAAYADARDALLEIRGVGPFSAAAILLRGLGRMDELPWMPQFEEPARALYGTSFDHAAIARRYGRQIGYWSFYVMTGVPRLIGEHHSGRQRARRSVTVRA